MRTEPSAEPEPRGHEPLPQDALHWIETDATSLPATWSVRATGTGIFAMLAVWAFLIGPRLSDTIRYPVEAVLILAAAAFTLIYTAHSGRANVRLERAYSEHLERLSDSLRQIAYHDSLTGLHNHRFFHEQLPREIERAKRYGHRLGVVMLDVNHFKEVNDRYGHLTGDDLLTFLGRMIDENVRSTDVAVRYGGDEFALILPETDAIAANALAAKLSEIISKRRDWAAGLLEDVALSVSAGVATFPDDGTTVEELLGTADRKLYATRSKRISFKPRPVLARQGKRR